MTADSTNANGRVQAAIGGTSENFIQGEVCAPNRNTVKTWPEVGSIKHRILECLRAGERLTSLEAWARFGTSRLASLIHQLRGAGWPIESETIEVETADGRIARVAQYSLDGHAHADSADSDIERRAA